MGNFVNYSSTCS